MYKVEDGIIKLENGSINEGLIAIASGKGGVCLLYTSPSPRD